MGSDRRRDVTAKDFDLSGVPRTLLMPLWGRAKATLANSSILSDERAVELVSKLNVDFQRLDQSLHPLNDLITVARERAVDDLVRAFIEARPNATIVNLGAGLDTAFHRVDNGSLRWFDVDLPEVIEIRKQLLPETDRSRCVSGSLLDPQWTAEIDPTSNGVFCFAKGVLVYLKKADLRKLLDILADAFPGSDLAFDLQSWMSVFFGNFALRRAGMGSARLRLGARTARPILKLHAALQLVEEFGSFAKFGAEVFSNEEQQRTARTMDRLRASTIVHAKFVRQADGAHWRSQ